MNRIQCVSLVAALSLALALPAAEAAKKKRDTEPKSKVQEKLEEGVEKNKSKPVGKGDTELGFAVTYDNYDKNNTNELFLTASVGKLVSDRAEISIEPTIFWIDTGGISTYGFDPFFAFKYMFRGPSLSNPVVPYVGAGIGFDVMSISGGPVSTSTYGVFVAPVGGLKAFLSERISLEYALSYNVGVISECSSGTCNGGSLTGLNNQLRFNVYY